MSRRVANTVVYVVFNEQNEEVSAGWSAQDAWDGIDFEDVPWAIGKRGERARFTNENIGEAQNRGWRCIVHNLVAQENGPPWEDEHRNADDRAGSAKAEKIPEWARSNFNTMLGAGKNGHLALLSAVHKETGKTNFLVTAVGWDAKTNKYLLTPFAQLLEENPFDAYYDPSEVWRNDRSRIDCRASAMQPRPRGSNSTVPQRKRRGHRHRRIRRWESLLRPRHRRNNGLRSRRAAPASSETVHTHLLGRLTHQKEKRMNHFERNCPKATAMVDELGLLPVHYRSQAYWSGDIQLTYLTDKDGSTIGKNWARHEEIALRKLNKIKTARQKAGTVAERLDRLHKALEDFLPQARTEQVGFWHLTPDLSGDEVCVMCGRGISRRPGVASVWVHLWDQKDKLSMHNDEPGSEHEKIKFPRNATNDEILACVRNEMNKLLEENPC